MVIHWAVPGGVESVHGNTLGHGIRLATPRGVRDPEKFRVAFADNNDLESSEDERYVRAANFVRAAIFLALDIDTCKSIHSNCKDTSF